MGTDDADDNDDKDEEEKEEEEERGAEDTLIEDGRVGLERDVFAGVDDLFEDEEEENTMGVILLESSFLTATIK